MAAAAVAKPDAAAEADDYALPHPLSVNIRPILESVAGILTDDEIDQWFVDLHRDNEKYGVRLELTAEGELVISPMVNRAGGRAESRSGRCIGELGGRLWRRSLWPGRQSAPARRFTPPARRIVVIAGAGSRPAPDCC